MPDRPTVLVVIDGQDKLVQAVSGAREVVANTKKLIQGARLFELPVIVTEQNPKGLGPTIPDPQELLGDAAVLEKMSGSASSTGSSNNVRS